MLAIRPYETQDFEGVRALWRRCFPNDPPRNQAEASIPAKLAFQPELFLVAILDGRAIGTTMAGYDGHRGWLYSVAVDPQAQRGGVGTALVRDAEARLRALGCVKINLQIRATNQAVIAFYRKLGFDVEDHLSMGKLLR